MSTVVNSIAQFNAAYLNYLLRNDEPLTDVVYAQALMFASRHSGRPLSSGTIAWINRVHLFASMDAAANAAAAHNVDPVYDSPRFRNGSRSICAEQWSNAWHDLFLAACQIPA